MPREQTAVERAKFALEYGPRKPFTLLIPHFADDGQDNSFFVRREDEEVAISAIDLEALLALIPAAHSSTG